MTRRTITRRDFVKWAAAAGGTAAAGLQLGGEALANRHPKPRPTSLPYLDRNMYRKNTDVLAIVDPGEERGSKMQMMSIGPRRFLFNRRDIIEVTDPLKPVTVNKQAYASGQIQVAYNRRLSKWILMTGHGSMGTFSTPKWPHGKYDNADLIKRNLEQKGLRGVRFYDCSDPTKLVLLSEWSCDQGDPKREVQTGSGVHRCYWDGGQYAYLDTGPDNTFTNMEAWFRYYTNGVQIIDVSDPTQPKFVSNWWVPGQRQGEEDAYRKWSEHGDKTSFTSLHGPVYVPRRVEDGGRYGYGAWGSFGMLIHDVSDVRNPKLVSRFNPTKKIGAIPFHTIDIARLDRGFVIANPEVLNPDCNEEYQPTYVIDVKNPASPRLLSTLPVPVPPADAPYKTFCDKRGRFGPHNPPHLKAPGRPDPNFTAYGFFNAGLQLYDVRDPAHPQNTGYFIPPQPGSLDDYLSFPRDTDAVFIEWDRKLMWVGAGSGLYLVSSPMLGKPVLSQMPVSTWSLPGLNAGAA
ncbi:MAG TPA: twin-arginine translocation signal domain-containing protein [Opitutaceae bacterium]|nr:twin-arginine translocation signal domain-containing protein [Opitutaceae bacterium]